MARLMFRFYEELNRYLPAYRRKREFEAEFDGQPTVRELIDALGVPSELVDLILVQGKSVDFSHVPTEGDRISVYPVFERLDIGKITRLPGRPLRAVKFVLEFDLRDLAAHMRTSGYDVYYGGFISRSEVIAISKKEKRIILTTDPRLLESRGVTHAILLPKAAPDFQMNMIRDQLDLDPKAKAQRGD